MVNENDLNVKTIKLSNELLLETIKILENCTSCNKDKKIDGNGFDKIETCLAELEKEEQGKKKEYIINELNDELNDELSKIDFELNNEVLCEGCKGKKVKKLTDKCGNEEIARFLYYQCKLNANNYNNSNYIRWIPFDKFKNIEYLAKGGFGEVHKAIWIDGYYGYEDRNVVLKRIHNSNDKIVDVLKEVE